VTNPADEPGGRPGGAPETTATAGTGPAGPDAPPGAAQEPARGGYAGPTSGAGRHVGRRRAAPPAAPAKKSSFWRELPFLILIALVLALLIKTFLVQAFYIPSASMEPTLQGGPPEKHYDRVLVNKLVYRLRDVHRGEIIVFKGPKSWQDQPEFISNPPSNPVARFFHDIGSALGVAAPSSKDFIKRVIAVGGDHVVCCDSSGRITVNGVPLDEPYIYPGAKPSDQPFDVTVAKGRLWVMGDNRGGSADSRSHTQDHDGTIPQNDVIGRAFVVVWPPSDWKTLSVPKTFHQKGLAAAAMSAAALPGAPLALGVAGAVPLTVLRRRRRRR
jgi:signal peptidase I